MSENSLPILYSFRRCPYAMRARLALLKSGIQVELREVALKDKPKELIQISPKATVPVLVTTTGKVIDESLDIMHWALAQHDPDNWFQHLTDTELSHAHAFINHNDTDFKYYLDRYKYADRYPQHTMQYYRGQAQQTLETLEQALQKHGCLIHARWSFADIAVLPFIRQFAGVDKTWFEEAPYPHIRQWLNTFISSDLFTTAMTTFSPWHSGQPPVLFSDN